MSEFPCVSVSKRVEVRNLSHENGFDLHENKTACRTHFHMKGSALRLDLKQRHKRTWKWPILREMVVKIPGMQAGCVSLWF